MGITVIGVADGCGFSVVWENPFSAFSRPPHPTGFIKDPGLQVGPPRTEVGSQLTIEGLHLKGEDPRLQVGGPRLHWGLRLQVGDPVVGWGLEFQVGGPRL